MTYSDAVMTLAGWQGGEGITVYCVDDPAQTTVRLVEVSEEFGHGPSADPFFMALRATDLMPYRTEIILLHPQDETAIHAGLLNLPTGWERAHWRLVAANGATREGARVNHGTWTQRNTAPGG